MVLSKEEVLDLMKEKGLVVKLKDEFNLDLRTSLGVPIICDSITSLVRDRIINKNYKQIIGIEEVGGAYATIIGNKTGLPSAILKQNIPGRYHKSDILGNATTKNNILLLSLYNGPNMSKAVKGLTIELGYNIKDIFVLLESFKDTIIDRLFTQEEVTAYFNSKK